MNETTPEQRREIAVEVNSRTKKGKRGNHPNWINTPEELIEQYREYCKRELAARHPEDTDPRLLEMLTEMYADLSAEQLEHDMPALTFFFRRYLAQR